MFRRYCGTLFAIASLMAFTGGAVHAALPASDDFNGGAKLDWMMDGAGTWEAKDDQLCASNFDLGGTGIVYLADVGGELTLQADVTVTKTQDTGVMRVGLVAHSNGGVGADKAWRLLWANAAEQPPAKLVFLEELVAWRKSSPTFKVEIGKTYTFKMEVRGNTARAKVWEKSGAEPADWMVVDNSFSSDQLDQTTVGLMAAGADACFDNFSAQALPVTTKGTLSGKVTAGGAALASASLDLSGPENKTIATGDDGSYSVDVDAGSYQVKAQAFGYTTVTKTADVTGNGQTTLNIELTPTTRKAATLTFKDGKPVENGLKIVFNSADTDGFVTFESKNGKDVVRTGPMADPNDDAFLYIDVDDTFLYGGLSKGKAYVTIEYLDLGTASFGIHYDSGPAFPAEQFKDGGGDVRTDSGEYKTYTWTLEDASFSNREQNFADFRVFDGGGGDDNDLYISKVTVSTVPPDQIPPEGTGVKGDVNADGKVTVADATILLRASVGLVTLTAAQQADGDMNGDGKVDLKDATQALRKAVGL